MDDMNAFERQVASEVMAEMPAHSPVDVAQVYGAAVGLLPGRRRGLTMTGSLGFTAAAMAAVALFGGALLLGMFTSPDDARPKTGASPTAGPSRSPLASLDLQPVGAGVFQVLGDGVHDFSAAMAHPGIRPVSVTAGQDGSVWLQSSEWAMPLGQPGIIEHSMRAGTLQVAPDGTVWVKTPDAESYDGEWPTDTDPIWVDVPLQLSSFDGNEWTVHPVAGDRVRGDPINWLFDVTTDGSLWFASTPNGARIARLDPDGWERLPGRSPGMGLLVTDDGTIWSQDNGVFYEDGRSRPLQTGDEETRVGRDGTVWLVWTGDGPMRLKREDDDGRETCAAVGGQGVQFHQVSGLSVAPDGSLWGSYREGREPDRLIRFDCTGWSFPLGDVPMARPVSMAIADDGSVWVVTEPDVDEMVTEPGAVRRQLYVISAEAFQTEE